MCNFVPGEVIAIGPVNALQQIGEGLPGIRSAVRPIISEIGNFPQVSPLIGIGSLTLKTDPGVELYAASRMSARLAGVIEHGDAIVDLNHMLPLSSPESITDLSFRLSAHAEREAASIRRVLREALTPVTDGRHPRRVGVLDSGLLSTYTPHRDVHYFDYSAAGQLTLDATYDDPLGHGTRVVSILDQILPPDVELSVGRLPSQSGSLTALTLAHAFGDLVAREAPEVVNVSVSPRNDWFICPSCRQRVNAPTFLSGFLPLLIRLGGKNIERTVTVMAAGNTGQIPNSRWLSEDIETLLFAVGENRSGNRARYSSAPDGPLADLFSAGAFGGDDPDEKDSEGVFMDGGHGTSYAAPFISAAALLSKQFPAPPLHGFPTRIGQFTRNLIETARSGAPLR